MNTAPQEFGLQTGLTIAGNNLALAQRAFAAPDLFDYADVRVRNVNNSEQARQAQKEHYGCETPTQLNPSGFCR